MRRICVSRDTVGDQPLRKRSPVCEIAISTNHPEQLIHLLTTTILEKRVP